MCYFITWNGKQAPIPRKKKKSTKKRYRSTSFRKVFEIHHRRTQKKKKKKRAPEGLAVIVEDADKWGLLSKVFPPTLKFFSLFHCSSSSRCALRYNVGCIASLLALWSAFTATCSRGWTIMNMQPFQSYWRFEITGARASCICERRASLSKLILRSKSAIVRNTSPKNEQHRSSATLIRPNIHPKAENLTGSKGWFTRIVRMNIYTRVLRSFLSRKNFSNPTFKSELLYQKSCLVEKS